MTASIQRLNEVDRPALRRFWIEHWGAEIVVARGRAYRVDEVDPGFAAVKDGVWIGQITFLVEDAVCEVTSINNLREGTGVGTALMRAVEEEARKLGCRCLRLVTTNDNTHALRFYQKYGFALTALRLGALDVSRRLKPSIPLIGFDGIPLRDELELEMLLDPSQNSPST